MAGKVALPITPGAGTNLAGFTDGDSRVRPIVINGTVYAEVGTYMAASYRLAGAASTPINLCTVRVAGGSPVGVAIRRFAVDVSVSATTAYLLNSYFRYFHNTGVTPSGGTPPSQKTQLANSAGYSVASNANVSILFPSSADGTASVITHALPSRSPDREQAHPAIMTGVGQWVTDDYELINFSQEPLAIFPGETGLLAIAGANSATHLHYTIKLIWSEFTP